MLTLTSIITKQGRIKFFDESFYLDVKKTSKKFKFYAFALRNNSSKVIRETSRTAFLTNAELQRNKWNAKDENKIANVSIASPVKGEKESLV